MALAHRIPDTLDLFNRRKHYRNNLNGLQNLMIKKCFVVTTIEMNIIPVYILYILKMLLFMWVFYIYISFIQTLEVKIIEQNYMIV